MLNKNYGIERMNLYAYKRLSLQREEDCERLSLPDRQRKAYEDEEPEVIP